MKRATLLLAALLLASPALRAEDKPVVVDPLDLRQPVPDPEAGLTQKYDGKTVRFTGVLHTGGTDAGKKRWYEFQTEVPTPASLVRAPREAKPKTERVVVRVYFQRDERSLRPQQLRLPLTVEGTGEILVDGTLVIRGATIVTIGTGSKR